MGCNRHGVRPTIPGLARLPPLRFLHDPTSAFGYRAAKNALLVVVLQMPITRLVSKVTPTRLMALGNLFYGAGFLMMLTGHHIITFALGVLVITLGETRLILLRPPG